MPKQTDRSKSSNAKDSKQVSKPTNQNMPLKVTAKNKIESEVNPTQRKRTRAQFVES